MTHGRLSEALLETTSFFVSDLSMTRAVTFSSGQGLEDLEASIRAAIQELDPNEGILVLVDLPGGSPARAAGTLLLEHPDMELVAGVNIPMLVEVLMVRESMTLAELAQHAVSSGMDGIVDIKKLIQPQL